MNPSSFAAAIAALRLDLRPGFAHIHPTPAELDAADALDIVQEFHQPAADEPDPGGGWGACSACDTDWPCKAWIWAEQLAVQWIGRAQDRYAVARQHLPEPVEPVRVGELLPGVLDGLAEACAAERVRARHTEEDNR